MPHARRFERTYAYLTVLAVAFALLSAAPAATAATAARDTKSPRLTITSPSAKAVIKSRRVKLAGVARDNRSITRLQVRIRNTKTRKWLRPNRTWSTHPSHMRAKLSKPRKARTRWKLVTKLRPGRYRYSVLTQDAARNWSKQRSRRLVVRRKGKPTSGGQPSRVVLTPTASPESAQSFNWSAAGSGDSGRVELVPATGDTTRTVGASAQGAVNGNRIRQYSATAAGLAPGTTYRYRVGASRNWSPWRTFTTADPQSSGFSFLYFGDAQTGLDTTWPRVVEAASAKRPGAALALAAGDLVNNADNDSQWSSWFSGLDDLGATRNLLPVSGNHEYLGDSTLSAWRSLFALPLNGPNRDAIGSLAALSRGASSASRHYAAYFDHFAKIAAETVYSSDYQGVRFVVLDGTRDQRALQPRNLPICSGSGCPTEGPGAMWMRFQAAWLDQVLAQDDPRWTVVSIHQPVFSSTQGFDERIVREHFLPVIQRHGVDLVLQGHDHVYSRGHLDSDATGTPGLTSGPVFVTANSGGQHLVLETNPAKNVWERNGATQARRMQGVATYQTMDVTSNRLEFRSHLVEKSGKAQTSLPIGAVIDEFTVTRGSDGQTWVTEPGVQPPA